MAKAKASGAPKTPRAKSRKGVGGRKPKMSVEKFEEVRLIVASSNYIKVACAFVGVSQSCFYEWIKKPENSEYLDTLRAAEASGEIGAANCLTNAARHDWKAAVAYLERRWAARWRKVTTVKFEDIPDDQLLRLLELTKPEDEDSPLRLAQ